jgi:hypothetical protein
MTRDWEADFAAEVWAAAEGVHPRDPGALDPETETIIYRMERGDLRPLAAAICEEPHPALGYALLHLIESGRLRIRVVVGKGAPQRPDLFGRKVSMYAQYDRLRRSIGSDAAFAKVAAKFGIGVETVRQAVTEIKRRGREPKPPKPPKTFDEFLTESKAHK